MVTKRKRLTRRNPLPYRYPNMIRHHADVFAEPPPIDHDPFTNDVLVKLEEGNYVRLAHRLGELRENEEGGVVINEGSAAQFAHILLGAQLPEPSAVGLDDQGNISASWTNRPLSEEEADFSGSVILGVPGEDKLYEVTAMFGVQTPGREWLQIVGKVKDKMALGLVDSVLLGFSNELRTTSQ